MPSFVPFQPSLTNYTLALALGTARYLFKIHWNSRDEAWYFDLREEDETPILLGVKIVLGMPLGRTSTHKFFQRYMLQAVDTGAEGDAGKDAGFDDLGSRIQVVITSSDEVLLPSS